MARYRRQWHAGGRFFFTLVTHRRRPILTTGAAPRILGEVLRAVQRRHPFAVEAIVLLPDHLHCIWQLPAGDADYALRWRLIKAGFTRLGADLSGPVTASRRGKGERGIWQRRYWEHTLLDEDDVRRHLDYIHFNPVRHGYVKRAADWPWSSFHRYVRMGVLPPDWGCEDARIADVPGE